MKVIHISYKDAQEGAAIAVDRICKSLIRRGIDSRILVQKKVSDSPYSRSIATNNLQKVFSFIRVGLDLLVNNLLVKEKSTYFTFPFIGTDISKHYEILEADIIHLHWINRGFLSLGSINKLLKLKKPIVWTLHDSWAFTGGCHMTNQCTKYQDDCKKCPLTLCFNFSSHFLKKKRAIFSVPSLVFTTPSSWMVEKARTGCVLSKKKITVMPNCVDTSIYKPLNSINCRKIFNLSEDKSIVLFNITNDMRKGIKYLHQVIFQLSENDKTLEFVGFGSSNIENTVFADLPIVAVGKINDNYSMATLYNACDVLIAPALEEPFGQTYIEAMACGTPCVAFDHSGPKDIIDHQENGYLAKYMDKNSLIDGVYYCLENKNKLTYAAVDKVQKKYSFNHVSQMHIDFYESILKNS